jgi:hypothetical protein
LPHSAAQLDVVRPASFVVFVFVICGNVAFDLCRVVLAQSRNGKGKGIR